MSRFLLLYAEVSGTDSPLDPGTLSPSEHYKEDGWFFEINPDWRDDIEGVNRAFDNGGSNLTPTSQNGLTCWESAGNSTLNSLSSLRSGTTWLEADNYITMYFVVRWDGGTTDYLLDWFGATGSQGFQVAMTTGDRSFFKVTDESSNILQLYPATVLSSGWQVWALKIQNLTNDSKATWINKQSEPISVSQSTWVKTGLENSTATNRIFTNLDLTLRWDGAMAELIMFRDNHDDSTMLRVNQFLQNKWDIT